MIVTVILAASHFQGKTVHCTTKIRGYRAGQGGLTSAEYDRARNGVSGLASLERSGMSGLASLDR